MRWTLPRLLPVLLLLPLAGCSAYDDEYTSRRDPESVGRPRVAQAPPAQPSPAPAPPGPENPPPPSEPPGTASPEEPATPTEPGAEPTPPPRGEPPPAVPQPEQRPEAGPAGPTQLQASSTSVTAGGRRYVVNVVRVKLRTARLKVGLARGGIPGVEALADMARGYGAVAAINGSFFDAYTTGPIKGPHHTVITAGKVVHKGEIGSVIGFTAGSQPVLGRLPLKIEGALDGSYRHPNNWWAYWINRLPSTPDIAIIYTPEWGPATGVTDGTQVVVAQGRVVRVGTGSQPIPADGFVLYLRGSQKSELGPRFRPGRRCHYRVVRRGSPGLGQWARVQEALGAGPRLLTDGRKTVDPVGEGFSHAKILSLSASRSMVGLTRDGWLILATSTGTVAQMAGVMQALGAYNAMNLDGGASSGLWAEGRYLTTPGRLINNALLVLPG
jgi:hypothetical protein